MTAVFIDALTFGEDELLLNTKLGVVMGWLASAILVNGTSPVLRLQTRRLMGFGHRVYKNYDPRAKVLRDTCTEVLNELNFGNEPLLNIAVELERIALSDEYFIERKLYPNVDFYSGIIYRAMGIPSKMFTVLFAVARTVGWVAQWKEMMEDPKTKIGRPRQLFIGETPRVFMPLDKR